MSISLSALAKTPLPRRTGKAIVLAAFAIASMLLESSIGAPAQADTLRLAIPNPPFARGNPYQAPGPAATYVMPAIFDALTEIDGRGVLHPGLALSWSSDPTARVWTFKLRPGVQFSNGAPFNAEAVVAALDYLTKQPQPSDLVPLEFVDITDYRALDPLTVEISAGRPMPLLPRAASVLFVVEPHTWRTLGPQAFAGAPVGTGPFQVEQWGAAGIKLSAFKKSWRAPKMDALEIIFQQDSTSRLQGLLAGRIDIALALGPEDREALAAGGAELRAVPIPSVTALIFLTAKAGSPFADVRVRQAVNYAVDKERLAQAFYGGDALASGQPATRTALGYDPGIRPYPYDPVRAKSLLADAGLQNGFSFTLEAVVGSNSSDGAVYQQIAQDLAAVDVRMTVRSVPGVRFGQVFRTGAWEGEAFAYLFGSEPAFDGIRALKYYTCDWRPQMYCDREVEPLFVEADAAESLDARAAIARRIMARYHDQAPGLFLYESPRFHGVSGGISDFRMENARIAFEAIYRKP